MSAVRRHFGSHGLLACALLGGRLGLRVALVLRGCDFLARAAACTDLRKKRYGVQRSERPAHVGPGEEIGRPSGPAPEIDPGAHITRVGEDPDEGLVAADRDLTKAILAALRTLRPGFELVNLLYGDGADLADAELLDRAITEAFAGIEVEVARGGQPLYPFLIAVW